MDSNLKNVLILLAFIVIIVLLFSYGSSSKTRSGEPAKEHYSAAFDPAYVDPRTGTAAYSRTVGFRPDESLPSIDSTGKIFDHLADQNLGVAQYTAPDDGFYNARGLMNDAAKKQVRFSDELVTTRTIPSVRKVDIKTSFQDTDIDRDRMIATNNIHNYCVHGKAKHDDTSRPYADKIEELFEMDMPDKEYYEMMGQRTKMKTFMNIEDDMEAGKYDEKTIPSKNQDIQGLKEITEVIDMYRDNTLDSIRGDYRGSDNVCCGVKMYDSVA